MAAVPLGLRAVPAKGADRLSPGSPSEGFVGSVIKKRRKRMAKKKHRKLLKKTRVQRRNKK
jgi:Mitochondrial domain of unknown function (DUF1713)